MPMRQALRTASAVGQQDGLRLASLVAKQGLESAAIHFVDPQACDLGALFQPHQSAARPGLVDHVDMCAAAASFALRSGVRTTRLPQAECRLSDERLRPSSTRFITLCLIALAVTSTVS